MKTEKKKIVIALDTMGGTSDTNIFIEAAHKFVQEHKDVEIKLFGSKKKIKKAISISLGESKRKISSTKNIQIIDCYDQVLDNETPVAAWRRGNETSMKKAIEYVKKSLADSVVSSGNTAALMLFSKKILGSISNIKRPAITTILPNFHNKGTVFLDLGANMECNKDDMFNFGIMGTCFAKVTMNIQKPKIGILNVGSEIIKGRIIEKETYKKLKNSNLNFVGFIEANEINEGKADVIITDGFSGNILLKSSEGTLSMFIKMLKKRIQQSSFLTKMFCVFLKKFFNNMFTFIEPNKYNGAMFTGINGIVVKSHGSANKIGIEKAITTAYKLAKEDINRKISKEINIINEDENLNIIKKMKKKIQDLSI